MLAISLGMGLGDQHGGKTTPVPSAATSTITCSPASVAADGVATSTVTLQAKTASGINITVGGATVTLNDGTSGLTPVVDHGDGTYTVAVGPRSSAVDEPVEVTGTLNGVAITHTGSVTFAGYTPTVVTFSTPGTTTWTVPNGVTSLQKVEAWGGGSGGAGSSAGGGGGAYSKIANLSVTPEAVLTVVVGAGSASGGPSSAGGDSSFVDSATLLAKGSGGAGPGAGIGGSAAAGVGSTKFSGGNGRSPAGGGGSSAGTASNGTTATSGSGAIAPAGGGNGGDLSGSVNGFAPGGGGSGGGGNGADGQVVITY